MYSTIHLPPPALDGVLTEFHRLLAPSGVLISASSAATTAAAFDHKVTTAYRWSADILAEHLSTAGFVELERLQYQLPERPDRRYATIAARAL